MGADRLSLLARDDKWYVGAGDGLIWAPPFPLFHHQPGFWDEAHLAQVGIGPLFTVSFVTPAGEALPAVAARTRWDPAGYTLEYRLGPGLSAREQRSALGGQMLASEWEFRYRGRAPRTLFVVLWTAVAGESVEDDGVIEVAGEVELVRTVVDRKQQGREVALAYSLGAGKGVVAAWRSEGSGPGPDFALTPFADRWVAGRGVTGEVRLEGIDRRGLVYVGVVRKVVLRGAVRRGGKAGSRHQSPTEGTSSRFTATVKVRLISPAVKRGTLSREPGPSVRPRAGSPATAARQSPTTSRRLAVSPRTAARQSWNTFTTTLPALRSTVPLVERYYWYRWYGLRLARIPAGLGHYTHDTVSEGIGYFHQPISYSAMCHLRELRWVTTPDWAQGVAHTFFDLLAPDGAMPGRVYLDHLVQPDFYHADWGGALQDLLDTHPDPAWLARLYPSLARYGEWLATTRDPEQTGMIDVTDQYETGQEYMSRYEAVDPDADRYGWENRLRLQGIDVTLYAWRLFDFLERHAPDAAPRALWAIRAARTAAAIRDQMWDGTSGMFSDLNPATGQRTGVKAAVCFYPYLTDLVDDSHLDGFAAHLFNPGEFWTPFPVPSSSADDPRYNPDAEWKGKRHVCPWNGRVWPMTNSHLVDALARVVRLHRPEWAPRLVHLTGRFLAMMHTAGDPRRPNCYEHYHPATGRGSLYRGIDDYQHSWVNDLLLRHVAGLIPRGECGIIVDPLPFGGTTELTGARVAGHLVDVRVTGRDVAVRIDGRAAGKTVVGRALELQW